MADNVLASTLSQAQENLQSGQYEDAYDVAKDLDTAEGYALASEALARQVMLGETENLKKTSKEARKLASKALELNPNNQNARLQHAITDGFVARLSGDVSAWMKKLPQKSFDLIEVYREAYPEDARGDALLGAWHLGVARKAGNANGNKWFGASITEGQRLYELAVLNRPDDPIVAVNYAFALMVLQSDDHDDWTRSKDLLTQALSMSAEDDLAQKVVGKAKGVLAVFDDKEVARRHAEAFLDGKVL